MGLSLQTHPSGQATPKPDEEDDEDDDEEDEEDDEEDEAAEEVWSIGAILAP